MLKLRLFTIFCFLLLAVQIHAATYYVRSGGTGEDCPDYTVDTPSQAAPTIAAALACMSGGDTLYIHGGTYTEAFQIDGRSSPLNGTSGAHTIISAYNSESVTLFPSSCSGTLAVSGAIVLYDTTYIDLLNLNIDATNCADAGIQAYGTSNHITIQGNGTATIAPTIEVKNSQANGIAFFGTTNNNIIRGLYIHDNGLDWQAHCIYISTDHHLIEWNKIETCSGYGIQAYNDTVTDTRISQNDIIAGGNNSGGFGSQDGGVVLGGTDNVFFNNIIRDSTGLRGVQLYNSGTHNLVDENTIYNNSGTGLIIQSGRSNDFVLNNIIIDSSGANISDAGSNTTINHNLCGPAACEKGTSNQNQSASSVFAGGGSLALKVGSLAIDNAANLGSSPYNTDRIGILRPQGAGWDIGAYEYQAPPPQNPRLVLGMAFETGSGPTSNDISGLENNGTLGTGVTWSGSNQGKYGNALSFSGKGGVTVLDNSSLNFTNYTIEAWIYPTTAPVDWTSIVAKYSNPNPAGYSTGYFLYYKSEGSSCPFAFAAAGFQFPAGDWTQVCDTNNVSLNTWSHIAGTYDGTTLTFYRNAQPVSTTNPPLMVTPTSGYLDIGFSIYGEFFTGKIDEVRIYNYARTQAQIQSDMNTPLVGAPGAVAGITLSAGSSIKLCASCSLRGEAQ